jgi:nucleotide-binding universal stress UspA family protein
MANGNSRVTLVHAIPGVPLGASRYMYHLMEPEYQRQLARDAWQGIAAMIPADAAASRKVHARVVTGDTVAAISRVAAEVNADLILMGVKARSAIGRLVFGSTAARVIRTAGRPVLAIPQSVSDLARARHGDPLAVAA